MGAPATEGDQDCVICMEVLKTTQQHELQAKELPCDHIFHKTCVDKWLKKHNTCPLCRFNVWSAEDESRNWEDSMVDDDDRYNAYIDLNLDPNTQEGHWNVSVEREGGSMYSQEDLEGWDLDYTQEQEVYLEFHVSLDVYTDTDMDTNSDTDTDTDVDSQVDNESDTAPHVDEDDQDCDMDYHNDNRDGTSGQITDEMEGGTE